MSDPVQNLKTTEIAAYCSTGVRTVQRWIESGRLKAFRLPGGRDFRVPADQFVAFCQANDIPVPESLAGHLTKKRVLIVDDEKDVREIMAEMLEADGFEVAIADDGFAVAALLCTFEPDVMTLDLNMPSINGFEVLRRMQVEVAKAESHPFGKVRVLIVSALAKSQMSKAVSLGADDYLAKPFRRRELLAKVNSLIESVASF